tara:strand:- start:60 stop:212 length:153 start_codon:yes stop_codon:yes gene_type:complete
MTIIAIAFTSIVFANFIICLVQLWERTQPAPAYRRRCDHPRPRRTPEDGW